MWNCSRILLSLQRRNYTLAESKFRINVVKHPFKNWMKMSNHKVNIFLLGKSIRNSNPIMKPT